MKKVLIASVIFLWVVLIAMGIEEKINGSEISNENYIEGLNEYINNKVMLDQIKEIINKQNEEYTQITDNPIKPEYDITLDAKIQDYIWEQSLLHNWSYEYLLALAYTESRFDLSAFNDSNKNNTVDGGLYQINSSNLEWINDVTEYELDIYNPYHNIDAAIVLLNYLRDKFTEMDMSEEELFYTITLAYNRGESGAIKYVKQNGFNNEYVDKVLNIKEQLEQFGTINEDL